MATKQLSEDFFIGMIAPFAVVAIVAPLVLLRAWVITVLWGWYVVPAFGVAPLRMAFAFGLSLLIGYVQPRLSTEDKRTFSETLAFAIMSLVFTLGFGWIGTLFI